MSMINEGDKLTDKLFIIPIHKFRNLPVYFYLCLLETNKTGDL